jgi:LysM repeat protein
MDAPDKRTPYEKWQDTIKPAKTDKRWSEYDSEITTALSEFATHLAGISTTYGAPKASLIKAMIWTESGGPDAAAWKTRPMQIGNSGDPGFSALTGGKEGGELILPAALKTKLNATSVNTPAMNIRAGIGYLVMRAASYETVSVLDKKDVKKYEYTVKSGDRLEKIAKEQGTTVAALKQFTPNLSDAIKVGQKVYFQKASMQKVIKSWKTIDVNFAATKYNVGDPRYADKLNYCLTFISA